MIGEEAGNLGEGEDEDEVEEQFERSDALLVGVIDPSLDREFDAAAPDTVTSLVHPRCGRRAASGSTALTAAIELDRK
jgi:hypothetical protein